MQMWKIKLEFNIKKVENFKNVIVGRFKKYSCWEWINEDWKIIKENFLRKKDRIKEN